MLPRPCSRIASGRSKWKAASSLRKPTAKACAPSSRSSMWHAIMTDPCRSRCACHSAMTKVCSCPAHAWASRPCCSRRRRRPRRAIMISAALPGSKDWALWVMPTDAPELLAPAAPPDFAGRITGLVLHLRWRISQRIHDGIAGQHGRYRVRHHHGRSRRHFGGRRIRLARCWSRACARHRRPAHGAGRHGIVLGRPRDPGCVSAHRAYLSDQEMVGRRCFVRRGLLSRDQRRRGRHDARLHHARHDAAGDPRSTGRRCRCARWHWLRRSFF